MATLPSTLASRATPPPAPDLRSRAVGSDSARVPSPAGAPDDGRPPRSRRGTSLAAVALVASLSGAAVAVPVAMVVSQPATGDEAGSRPVAQPVMDDEQAAASDTGFDARVVAARVTPSVVRVDVVGSAGQGSGSGVAWSDDGIIVTNNHVVAGARQVRVTTSAGEVHEAEVLGTWPAADLAVVRVDATLDAIEVADGPVELGEQVLAVGSPFGLDGSVTSGIVSATGRTVTTSGAALTNLVQTDAAINPGNSGGALVNAAGELVGINTVIATSGGGSDGIGFAIDAATVDDVVVDLLDDGTVTQPVLGVTGAPTVDPSVVGAPITSVAPGSAADAGGLVPGDLVTAIDGGRVTGFAELAARIVRLDPGDEVTLDVTHADGTTSTVQVTLQAMPGS